MDFPFDARLHPSAKLVRPARLFCLLIYHLHNKLGHHLLPGFSHPHGPHSTVLAESNQAAQYE